MFDVPKLSDTDRAALSVETRVAVAVHSAPVSMGRSRRVKGRATARAKSTRWA